MAQRPEIIAHRGTPREHPENSLPGFARALELGADGLELDVHVTADGVPVVHHDAELHGGALDGHLIARLPVEAVLKHELAPKVRVPPLAEVLLLASGRATTYVEIKQRDAEERVAAVVEPYGDAAPVHSFDHVMARRVAARAGGVPCGVLSVSYLADPVGAMRAAGARDLWQHWTMIDAPLVETVHAAGGRVIVWTVNDQALAAQLVAMGVDGICTDVPGELAGALGGASRSRSSRQAPSAPPTGRRTRP